MNGLPSFASNSPVHLAFNLHTADSAHLTHLNSWLTSPFTLPPQSLKDGILALAVPNDAIPASDRAEDNSINSSLFNPFLLLAISPTAQYYLRVLIIPNAKAMEALLDRHLASYPANLPFVMVVRWRFRQEITQDTSSDSPFCLTYEGVTIAGTPLSRLFHDASKAASKSNSRVTNFNKSLTTACLPSMVSYGYPRLATTVRNSRDLLVTLLVGNIEVIGVQSGLPFSLNSALGGLQPLFAPNPKYFNLLSLIGATRAQLNTCFPLDDENSPFVVANKNAHLSQYYQIWRALLPKDTGTVTDKNSTGGKFAYESVEADLLSTQSRNGIVVSATLKQDITLSALKGETTLMGELAGTGPWWQCAIMSMVLGLVRPPQ